MSVVNARKIGVAAFFGMATNFGEACLAQLYKTKDEKIGRAHV